MPSEVAKLSWWDTLRLQCLVTVPNFLVGLVAPNRWVLPWMSRRRSGRWTMRFLHGLPRRYGCERLWTWFPFGRTLLLFDADTIDAVLRSEQDAADPAIKKRALSRFVPDALVISSGAEWADRRRFNEAVLETGHALHSHHGAFAEVVSRAVESWSEEHAGRASWPDFQALGQRIAHEIIFGAIQPELTAELARMVRCSNILLRHRSSFSAFYDRIAGHLARPGEAVRGACLVQASAALLQSGSATAVTRVPAQIGFWCFVLKEAIELHAARTLALIAAHQEVQARAREEVRRAGMLTPEAIHGLAYVEACVAEQLRLWTPVPILLRRAVARVALSSDAVVEPGDQILIHAGSYHRDPRFFGEHADTFSPDAVDRYPALYSFSARRQSCAGRPLVTFLLKATVAALLDRFRFELLGPAIEPGAIACRYNHFAVAFRLVPEP